MTRLSTLGALEQDWDGEGSIAIPSNVVQYTSHLLLQLSGLAEPDLGAVPDGGIDIEWSSMGILCTVREDFVLVHQFFANECTEFSSKENDMFSVVSALEQLLS
jgi:hypothetical protein